MSMNGHVKELVNDPSCHLSNLPNILYHKDANGNLQGFNPLLIVLGNGAKEMSRVNKPYHAGLPTIHHIQKVFDKRYGNKYNFQLGALKQELKGIKAYRTQTEKTRNNALLASINEALIACNQQVIDKGSLETQQLEQLKRVMEAYVDEGNTSIFPQSFMPAQDVPKILTGLYRTLAKSLLDANFFKDGSNLSTQAVWDRLDAVYQNMQDNIKVDNAIDLLRKYEKKKTEEENKAAEAQYFGKNPEVWDTLQNHHLLCLGAGDSNLVSRVILEAYFGGNEPATFAFTNDSGRYSATFDKGKVKVTIEQSSDLTQRTTTEDSGLLLILPNPFNTDFKAIFVVGLTRYGTANILERLGEFRDVDSCCGILVNHAGEISCRAVDLFS
ncbi:MAG: hypothetical protein ACKO37_08325 [Vampirovibrionales bacterium]